ncbi:DUF1003 domain-containing protein [Robbsia sp. Bb-Pol-6]|uniref:DUF1003 domain-containing protein n=1 Tax=Robbsia betulipollinis TaxID=2981849 RepID=A0ABT3ZI01_9BURK|nr:DUF1003 domain-containing protein [Robbsia betulipollinis]
MPLPGGTACGAYGPCVVPPQAFPDEPGSVMQPSYREQQEQEEQDEQAQQNAVGKAIEANLDKIDLFAQRQDRKISVEQRIIERICLIFGTPRFFILFLAACVLWIAADYVDFGISGGFFDAPPFSELQGVVSFMGVLITIAVLIRQNRLARVEGHRAHLELQVNLLAEQKTTKIIQLLEELRRDMPDVRNRSDEHAETLQEIVNPDAVLQAIEARRENGEAPEQQ